MIKTSQFFPFRFPLTRIRACFSVRTSPPFLSAEKTFHRLFYLLYLIPPLSSSSLSSSLPCCVLFLFRLAFFLSPPSLFFFISHSLSLSTLLPPPFFFKSIRTLCVQRRASRNFFPLTIFPILVLLVLPPLLDGARLDVASAWHYFARLSHVIFHPFTLNVTPNRLIFRSRAGFLFFFFSLPPRYLLRPHLPLSLIRWPLYIYRVRINL